MPRRNRNRRRTRAAGGNPRAGTLTYQYAIGDNVDAYTTINLTTSTLKIPTDRPIRIRRVRIEYAAVPDSEAPKKSAHVPVFQFNVMVPSGTSTPEIICRSQPKLVPLGPVRTLRLRVPTSRYYTYDSAQTVVLQMIVSGSAGLAVTANFFVTVDHEYPSYNGLDGLTGEIQAMRIINH